MYSYNFKEVYGLATEDEIEIWKNHSDEIIRTSKPLEMVVDYLRKEKAKGSTIILVTARHIDFLGSTTDWLHKYDIPYDKLYMGATDKYDPLKQERISQFLDDKGSLIENLMNTDLKDTCELTLVDAPYNRGFASHSRFYVKRGMFNGV